MKTRSYILIVFIAVSAVALIFFVPDYNTRVNKNHILTDPNAIVIRGIIIEEQTALPGKDAYISTRMADQNKGIIIKNGIHTDSQGKFSFPIDKSAKEILILACADLGGTNVSASKVVNPAEFNIEITLILPRGASLCVTVLDESQRKPVENAIIEYVHKNLNSIDAAGHLAHKPMMAKADDKGTCVFKTVKITADESEATLNYLRVSHADFKTADRNITIREGDNYIKVFLAKKPVSARVIGQIASIYNKSVIEKIRQQCGKYYRYQFSITDFGKFTLQIDPSNPFLIRSPFLFNIWIDGFQPFRLSLHGLKEGETIDKGIITLVPGGKASGKVVREDGSAVTNAKVKIRRTSVAGFNDSYLEILTNNFGKFEFNALADDETYVINAQSNVFPDEFMDDESATARNVKPNTKDINLVIKISEDCKGDYQNWLAKKRNSQTNEDKEEEADDE